MDRLFIDVREPYEFASGHVPGAINIPPMQLLRGIPKELEDIPKDTELVLYCLSGSRSATSARILQSYGFTNLINGINKNHVTARYFS